MKSPRRRTTPPTPPVPIKSHENKLMRQNEGRGKRGSEHERAKGVGVRATFEVRLAATLRGWVGSPILYVRRGKYPPQSRRLPANCEPEERRTRSSASRNFDGWRKAPRGRKRCESVNQVTTVVVRRSHSQVPPSIKASRIVSDRLEGWESARSLYYPGNAADHASATNGILPDGSSLLQDEEELRAAEGAFHAPSINVIFEQRG